MDGCSLNDAFPSGAFGSADCGDQTTAEESRRQEKKKARRCRGPASTYLNGGMNMVGAIDPDRSVKRMDAIPKLNQDTGLTQHAPVTQAYQYESFVGEMDNLPDVIKTSAGPTALQMGSTPSFFGANPTEDPLKKKTGLVEAFSSSVAPFVNVIGEDETYRLQPDFATTFDAKGLQKASGTRPAVQEPSYLTPSQMSQSSVLPFPNVDNFWKNTSAGGQSSFFAQLKAPGGQPVGSAAGDSVAEDVPSSRREVIEKLDRIFARLDDMDNVNTENSQTEIMLFILTGLGVIFLMDIGCRAASRR